MNHLVIIYAYIIPWKHFDGEWIILVTKITWNLSDVRDHNMIKSKHTNIFFVLLKLGQKSLFEQHPSNF